MRRDLARRPDGLHGRGLNDVLEEVEPAHAERPGQHGDQPTELVAKKCSTSARGLFMWLADAEGWRPDVSFPSIPL